MLKLIISKSTHFSELPLQIISSCCLGLLLGLAFLWVSPLLVLVALSAIFVIYAMVKRPAIVLLGILIATSSILFENQLPTVSIGISLHVPDFMLLGWLGIIVVRRLVEPGFKIVRTSLDWPLLFFFSFTLLSTINAVIHSSVDSVEARRWIRVMTYYFTFFIVTNLVGDRRQLIFLLNGFFLLATIVAGAMVLQFLLGNSIRLLPGTVTSLSTQGTIYEDITRIVPPGFSIVLVSFVTLICMMIVEKNKPSNFLKFFQCGLMGMALLLTFFRSYWAALIVVLFLLVFYIKETERKRLIGWSLVVIISASIILLIIFGYQGSRATKLIDASLVRVTTLIKGETYEGKDSSLNWRMLENRYAFSAIVAHPVIGLGMGARYRPYDPRLDLPNSTYDFRKHIHNGYLWILLDMGLLGFLAFMWLSFTFLIRSFRSLRRIADNHLKGVVLGLALSYVVVMIAAVANSTFVQWSWTPVIGIIMGINEVILRGVHQEIPIA
jgi:O-antigen ligase